MTDQKTLQGSISENGNEQATDLRHQWLKNPKVLAERILDRPSITCSLTMPIQKHTKDILQTITTTFPFYMEDEFGFGLSNEWASMLSDNGINTFSKLLNGVGLFDSDGKVQLTTQSKAMTAKVWQGSKFDGFNINCLFIATNRNINTFEIIKALSAACLPNTIKEGDKVVEANALDLLKKGGKFLFSHLPGGIAKGAAGIVGTLGGVSDETVDNFKNNVTDTQNKLDALIESVGMAAPLFYGLTLESEKAGTYTGNVIPRENSTLTLQIGDYFRAKDLVVQSISNVRFSKELIARPLTGEIDSQKNIYHPNTDPEGDYGFPLYVKCTLNLQPCTMITQDDFEAYFIKANSNSSYDYFITSPYRNGVLTSDVIVPSLITNPDTTISGSSEENQSETGGQN